jgi:hypothetical protein
MPSCGAARGNTPTIQHLIDQQVHQGTRPLCRHAGAADLPLCLSANMPHLPGRPARLHHAQDVIGCLCDPAGIRDPGDLGVRRQCRLHHRRHSARSAQHRRGLAEPCCALLSQGSGLVFGVAGLQRRLLRQMQRFDRRRWPAMILLETDRQLTAAGVDAGAAGRPASVQSGVDTDDLPDRPLRRIGARPFREPHPQRAAEVLFEGGVVDGMRKGLRPRSQIDVGCRRLTP